MTIIKSAFLSVLLVSSESYESVIVTEDEWNFAKLVVYETKYIEHYAHRKINSEHYEFTICITQ